MLENYLIQGAIVSQKTTAFSREPLIATTREEILRHCEKKPVFGEQARLEKTGFSSMGTYSPIIPAIKDLERMHLSCVAMVGTPCQIRTVRKMQCLGISSAHIVGYTIGLFCMGQLSLDALGRKKLEDRLHIDLADVDDLDVGEDLRILLRDSTAPGRRQAYGHAVRASSAAPSATLRASAQDSRSRLQRDAQDSRSRLQRDAQEGRLLRVPFEEVSQVARPTCLACTEFANDYADIAVGELGSPDGYATTITRTEKGDRVYHGALGQGYIAEKESTSPAELRSEKTRMLASVVAFARRKRERGEARLRELGAESD
jgi:coenzyme F420 hydrogenase subunit beta